MKRFFPQAWLVAGLLAGTTVCASGCRRRHPHMHVPPVPPVPTAAAVAAPSAVSEESVTAGVPVRPLPPRNVLLSPIDKLRWQMHDNALELAAISKQRLQREEQVRARDPEAQRLFREGGSGLSAYQTRIRLDKQIQDFDKQGEPLYQRQSTWAEMCRKLERGTATP